MATTKTPKSILKKTSTKPPPTADPPSTPPTDNSQHLTTALYHASLLQARKDLTLEIVLATETLMDLPSSPSPTPSAADISLFTSLLVPFTPSDYDDLVLERNVNGHCGYVLCPNPNPKSNSSLGGYRIFGAGGKAKDFKIVKREDAERWCSEDCARKALWVRVQLSEVPAWERVGGLGRGIEILKDNDDEEGIVAGLKGLELGKGATDERMDELAVERGELGVGRKDGLVGVDLAVKERKVIGAVVAPSLEADEPDSHMALEGHMSRFESQTRKLRDKKVDEDEEMKIL